MKKIVFLIMALTLIAGCDTDNEITGVTDLYRAESVEMFNCDQDVADVFYIYNINGNIVVNPGSDDSIRVTMTKFCIAEEMAEAEQYVDSVMVDTASNFSSETQLKIEIDQPDEEEREYGVDFEVLIPADQTIAIMLVNGTVIIEEHEGTIAVNLINGQVTADFAVFADPQQANISLTNGDAAVTLPIDTDAQFSTAVVNGSTVITGFPDVTYDLNTGTHKAGQIGSGGPTVSVHCVNGTASIMAR